MIGWTHCQVNWWIWVNIHIEHSWWNRKKALPTHLPHLLDGHLFCYDHWAVILSNLYLTTNTSEDDHCLFLFNVPSNCDNLPNSFLLITGWVSRDVLLLKRKHRSLVLAEYILTQYPTCVVGVLSGMLSFNLRRTRWLCFHLSWFVCPCVCLSICLLATLRENVITDFHEITGLVGLGTRNNLEYFQDAPFNPLNTANLF